MAEDDPHEPMNDLSDDSVRKMLGKINVPHDLRAKLLQIPEQDVTRVEIPTPRLMMLGWRRGMVWGVAVAAGVMASVLGWRYLVPSNEQQEWSQQPMVDANQAAPDQNAADSAELETQRWLAAYQAETESLRREIVELEIAELLERQVVKRRPPLPELSHRESVALAYALSGELMHEWAGATPVVQEQLNRVVRAFPDTKGSELALQILSN
jgi:hypothetical protein